MRWPLLALVAGACQHGSAPPSPPPPSCVDAAAHVLALLQPKDERAQDIQTVFATRCRDDRWPADVRICIVGTASMKDPKHCKSRLTIAQRSHLDAALQEAAAAARVRMIPAQCRAYAHVVDKLTACTNLPQTARDSIRQGYDIMSRQWSRFDDEEDRRTTEEGCKAAADAMRQAGASLGCDVE